MMIGRIRGANFCYSAPPDMPDCQDLHVNIGHSPTGVRWMTSAWFPSLAELELLIQGQPIWLHIAGDSHPVVAMSVPPE